MRSQKNYPVQDYDSVEHLGEMVERDFKALVDSFFFSAFPASEDQLERLSPSLRNLWEREKEKFEQRGFLKRMLRAYVSVPKYEGGIDDFVQGTGRGLVIVGDSGIGKSALLANWVQNRGERQNEKIIYHFIDQSRAGGDYRKISDCLIEKTRAIARKLRGFPHLLSQNQPSDKDWQKSELQNLLEAVKDKGKLIIILDGMDKLSDTGTLLIHTGGAKLLNWLPDFPDNVKFIFSTQKNDATMDYFKRMEYQCLEMDVLDVGRRKTLIALYLDLFGKKLTPTQIECIASNKESGNPLVLRTMLDELRVFGVHEELNARINHYLAANSIEKFFALVLKRLEESYGESLVRDVFSLIATSRSGLSESEIRDITGVATLYWSQLFDGAASQFSSLGGLITFSNGFILNAVKSRYLSNATSVRKYRKTIADFMKYSDASKVSEHRSYEELSYQLFELADWDALYDFLVNFDVFMYLFAKNMYDPIKYWATLQDIDREKYAIEKYLELDPHGRTTDIMSVLFSSIGICATDPSTALTFAKKAVAVKESVYGANSIEAVQEYMAAGVTSALDGQKKQQLEYRIRALSICKDKLGEEDIRTAQAYYELGMGYISAGFPQNAFYYTTQAIAIQEKVLPHDHHATAASYWDLALIYSQLGDKKMYLEYSLKAVSIMEKSRGKMNPQTLAVYSDLASAYSSLGDYEKAVDYAERCLAMVKNVFGENNLVIASIYAIFGEIHGRKLAEKPQSDKQEKQKVLDKFLECMQAAITIYSNLKKIGVVAKYLNEIGAGYECIGDYENAIAYYQRSLTVNDTEDTHDDIRSLMEIIEKEKEWFSLDYNSEEVCVKHVESDGRILKFVPQECRTDAVCIAAVRQNGLAIEYVPKVTADICMAAVRQNGLSLAYIPIVQRTLDICLEAIRENGLALEHVPEKLKTTELCLEAVKHDLLEIDSCMKSVPESIQTEEFCLAAIKVNIKAIKYISPALRTMKVCHAAIGVDGLFGLKHTPTEIKTIELCLDAVRQNGEAFMFVPGKYRTRELCLDALANTTDGNVIRAIQENMVEPGFSQKGNAPNYV